MVSSAPKMKPLGTMKMQRQWEDTPPAAFLSSKSRTSPVDKDFALPLEVLERVAGKICQGMLRNRHLREGAMATGILLFTASQCGETSQTFCEGTWWKVPKWISGQIPMLGAILSALRFLNWVLSLEQSSVLKPLSCHLSLHCCLPRNVSITVLLFIEQH